MKCFIKLDLVDPPSFPPLRREDRQRSDPLKLDLGECILKGVLSLAVRKNRFFEILCTENIQRNNYTNEVFGKFLFNQKF